MNSRRPGQRAGAHRPRQVRAAAHPGPYLGVLLLVALLAASCSAILTGPTVEAPPPTQTLIAGKPTEAQAPTPTRTSTPPRPSATVAIATETAPPSPTPRPIPTTAVPATPTREPTPTPRRTRQVEGSTPTATSAPLRSSATPPEVLPPSMPTPTPVDTATREPATSPTATETPPPTATPAPEGTRVLVEANEGAELSPRTALGELNVEYPLRMNAGTSNVVVLQVYIPAMLASLSPMEVERVEIPEDAPAVEGTLNRYQATIMVGEAMRVELHSLTFQIEELYPATQHVNLDDVNKATIWSWEIKAPDNPGSHVITLRAYVGDEARPVWVRGLEIEVVDAGALVPTTLPVPTPTPEEPSSALGWLIAVLLGVVGLAGGGLLLARRGWLSLNRGQGAEPGTGAIPAEAGPESPGAGGADQAWVRRLLLEAFGAEELRRLCVDDPRLRPIRYDLDEEPSPNEVVDAVLNYCSRPELMDYLLALVRQQRPDQYKLFAPPESTPPPPPAAS